MKLSSSFIAIALSLSSLTLAAPQDDERIYGKPLVSSQALQATTSKGPLLEHARQFLKFSQLSNGTRSFGTAGHNATVDYIKRKLEATKYYDVELQTFPYLFSTGESTLAIDNIAVESTWFTFAPSGDVSRPLTPVANLGCDSSDFPAEVEGNIAFISRGSCDFGLKVALAGAAKAAGAIIYNNAPEIFSGTLGSSERPDVGPYVPAAGISGEAGQELLSRIANGAVVTATLHVDATNEDRYSSNVLATTKGGDKNNIIMAGGHTDSVPAGPGINDDGSGTITILDIALRLPSFSVKNAVRFGFWTAEEFGLIGSEHYVTHLPAEEVSKIALYLNLDMVASPNPGYFIYDGDGSAFNLTGPAGSDHIEKTFEDFFKSKNTKTGPTAFDGRSDYGPFLDVNIPSGGLFTGAEGIMTEEEAKWWGGKAGVAYDACYHQKCDDTSNLHTESWVLNTKATAHAIATYARSLDGISRTAKTLVANNRVASLSYDDRRHYACGHKIETI